MARTPLRVGLTGGAAAGKSTVAAAFARRGVSVFSADHIAHELTAPGAPLLADIRDAFGAAVFDADGALDRPVLAATVFGDRAARRRLEAILHPPIREALKVRVRGCDTEYCMIEIPLLAESDIGPLVDRVLVVDLAPDEQLRRMTARDRVDEAHARRVLSAQPDRAERLALADDVLVNDGGPDTVDAQVERLHALYLDIAHHGDPGRPGLRLPAG